MRSFNAIMDHTEGNNFMKNQGKSFLGTWLDHHDWRETTMLWPCADETQVLQLKGVCVPEIWLVMILKAPETIKLGHPKHGFLGLDKTSWNICGQVVMDLTDLPIPHHWHPCHLRQCTLPSRSKTSKKLRPWMIFSWRNGVSQQGRP